MKMPQQTQHVTNFNLAYVNQFLLKIVHQTTNLPFSLAQEQFMMLTNLMDGWYYLEHHFHQVYTC